MKVIALLIVVGLLGQSHGDTVQLNRLVDQLLASANEVITQDGKDVIPVRDISSRWKQRLHVIRISGKLTCKSGQVGHLATLRRTGDASMTTHGNKVTVSANVGLGSINAHFDNCRAKLQREVSVRRKIDASVDSNSIALQVSFTYGPDTCQPNIDYIAVDHLGEIRIKTGGGVFDKFLDKLINLITNHFRGDFKDEINKTLREKATEAITKNAGKICEQIPH